MLTALGLAWVGLATLPWAVSHFGLGPWCADMRLERASEDPGSILVVIPARNEAGNIDHCLSAARQIRASNLEICVVDDDSGDGTASVAADAADGDPRVRVVTAPPRPRGWAGKSWAAHHGQMGEQNWILFMDADVRIDPELPASMVERADASGADLISCFGTWEMPTLGTLGVVPAIGWLIRGLVQPTRVRSGATPFANGQMILVRRSAYEAAGGHEAVRGRVLDDVALAESVARSGGRLDVVWARWGFRVRAYDSIGDTVAGYRKNLAAGLGGGVVPALLGAVAILFSYLGAMVGIVAGILLANLFIVAAGVLGLGLLIGLRLRLEWVDGRSGWAAWMQPLAGAVIAYTLVASTVGPAEWKGRRFRRGNVVEPNE